MLLAVTELPTDAGARVAAARLSGLALADFDRRLAGGLPRILLPAVDAETAAQLVPALEQLGYRAVCFTPETIPSDQDRIVARRLQFTAAGLEVEDAAGDRHHCPPGAVALLQRALRVEDSSWKSTHSERRLDVGKALLTGGLMLTRRVERTTVHHRSTEQGLLLVERADGLPDIVVRERGTDYRFLGDEMSPSSRANLDLLWRRLQAFAPQAPADERLSRPAFVGSLPLTAADPLDLGFFLVSLARARQAGRR